MKVLYWDLLTEITMAKEERACSKPGQRMKEVKK
jgi:hypothetical protein